MCGSRGIPNLEEVKRRIREQWLTVFLLEMGHPGMFIFPTMTGVSHRGGWQLH